DALAGYLAGLCTTALPPAPAPAPAPSAAAAAAGPTVDGPAPPDGPGSPPAAALVTVAASARRSLDREAAVLVPLPAPYPPVVVTAAHLQQVAAPVLDEMVEATRQAIEAAEVTASDCVGLFLVGGGGSLAPVAQLLAEQTGVPT